MRVLIVGSSGFIGSHLARHLVACGHEVEGWSRRRQAPFPGFEPKTVDVLRSESVGSERRPWDAAVLLAAHAVPGAHFGMQHAIENLTMTAHALDHFAGVAPGARVIVMSSGHVYAAHERPRTEDDAIDPVHPYAISKAMCECWARARRHELDVHIVRSFSQMGPRMPAGLFLPDLLQALTTHDRTIELRGSDSTRDFLDVRDGVVAIERLLHVRAPSGSTWNVCSGVGVPVSALARRLMAHLGDEREIGFARNEPDVRIGSPAKIRAACDWNARYTLDESLVSTLAAMRTRARDSC